MIQIYKILPNELSVRVSELHVEIHKKDYTFAASESQNG